MKANILITGGTGGVGKRLVRYLLDKDYHITILSRKPHSKENNRNLHYALWNPENDQMDVSAIQNADFIIHLAGENIGAKRWSKIQKEKILNSRIKSSQLLIHALSTTPNNVQAVISASAIGFYGADINKRRSFTEEDSRGDTFLSRVCNEWEKAIEPLSTLGIRLVILRTGVVLDPESGALNELLQPLKYRIATILGSGRQWMSWVHYRDLCSAYLSVIENAELKGIYNISAPHIVTYKQLILRFAKVKYNRAFIRVSVPRFVLKLIKGEMIDEMVLTSTSVSSSKLLQTGFHFEFPRLDKACIRDLLKTI